MRHKGSDGGHNGLAHISQLLEQMNIQGSGSGSETDSAKEHRSTMFLEPGLTEEKKIWMKRGFQL